MRFLLLWLDEISVSVFHFRCDRNSDAVFFKSSKHHVENDKVSKRHKKPTKKPTRPNHTNNFVPSYLGIMVTRQVQFCCIFAATKDKFDYFLKKLFHSSTSPTYHHNSSWFLSRHKNIYDWEGSCVDTLKNLLCFESAKVSNFQAHQRLLFLVNFSVGNVWSSSISGPLCMNQYTAHSKTLIVRGYQ